MVSEGDVMRIADKFASVDFETLLKFAHAVLTAERVSKPLDEQAARASVSALIKLVIKKDDRYVCDCRYVRWGAVEADLHTIVQRLAVDQNSAQPDVAHCQCKFAVDVSDTKGEICPFCNLQRG